MSLDHFGVYRAGGNGRAAAVGLEFNVGDDVVLDLDIHFHDVAALGVTHLADSVGIGDLTDIAGVCEVFHNLFGIHIFQLLFFICFLFPVFLFFPKGATWREVCQ